MKVSISSKVTISTTVSNVYFNVLAIFATFYHKATCFKLQDQYFSLSSDTGHNESLDKIVSFIPFQTLFDVKIVLPMLYEVYEDQETSRARIGRGRLSLTNISIILSCRHWFSSHCCTHLVENDYGLLYLQANSMLLSN